MKLYRRETIHQKAGGLYTDAGTIKMKPGSRDVTNQRKEDPVRQ